MNLTCPECGRPWGGRATYCGACGAALTTSSPTNDTTARWSRSAGPGRPAPSVLAGVSAVLVAGIVVWAVAAGRGPSPAVEEASTEPGTVDLPSPGVGTAVPAGSADLPLDLVATCPAARESDCVRWVQPGPRAWFGRTAPVVPDGTGRSIVVGTEDRVRSLDLDTGQARWTVGIRGGAVLVQQVGAGLVAVQDADGVRGLDAVDGDVRWSVAGGNLLAGPPHAGPLPLAVVTTPDGVTARDPEDGTVVWSLPDAAGMPATVVPVGGGQLLVGGVVVDAVTGTVAWDSSRGDTPTQPVAAGANRVLVLEGELPDDAALVLRAASHGQHLARLDVDPARVVGTSIVGEFVVLQTADAMAAFRLDDGALAWRRTDRRGVLLAAPPALGPYPGLPGVAIPAPGLAVRRADGTILVLDPATGAVRHRLGSSAEDQLDLGDGLTADGRVFRIDDDRLRVFDLDDGALLADVAVRTPEVASTSPVVVLTAGRLVRLELPAAAQ